MNRLYRTVRKGNKSPSDAEIEKARGKTRPDQQSKLEKSAKPTTKPKERLTFEGGEQSPHTNCPQISQ